ncbi:MAG: hypothetical protein K0U36_06260 [Alphaproteobacteria bacterium]|nr:hypothetical protein [Alphaproteobacteria bacterium]
MSNTDLFRQLLRGASIEITPSLLRKKPELLNNIPAGTEVFITHLPDTSYSETADAAKLINGSGAVAVPHLAARSVADDRALEASLELIADCSRVLLLGGSRDKPIGAFHEAYDLMPRVVNKFDHVYVAGHPENAPNMPVELCDDALLRKVEYAGTHNQAITIVTQFGFDHAAYLSWDERVSRLLPGVSIRYGVAGPASLKQLIHYATLCGIGNSLRFLTRQATKLTGLLTSQSPSPLVQSLADHIPADAQENRSLHIFPLGGFAKSIEWKQQASD